MAQVTAKQAVAALSDFANGAGWNERQEFAELVQDEHRTLQQGIFRLFLLTCQEWAKCEEGQYDLRNEVTVQQSKKILETLGGVYVPLI